MSMCIESHQVWARSAGVLDTPAGISPPFNSEKFDGSSIFSHFSIGPGAFCGEVTKADVLVVK